MADTRQLKNFEFGNATDTGRVREANEDYLGYFESVNGHIFVVCDGMGGHVGGAIASQLAVESVRSFLETRYFDDPNDALKDAIRFANSEVFRKAAANAQLTGMGTTLVMVMVRGDQAYYAHVGDSRLYLQTQGKLHRLTRDHSYVQTLFDDGLISADEMETHPRKNEILEALGVKEETGMDVCTAPVKPANSDILLLCSDGLNSMVNDKSIESILNEDLPLQHKAMKLVQAANDAGGYDNTTVQLIHFYNVSNKKTVFVHAGLAEKDKDKQNISPKKLKMKRNIMIGVIILSALAILYFIWDMFIRSSAPAPLTDSPEQDTAARVQTEQPVAQDTPVTQNQPEQVKVLPVSGDTVWVDYTVKSGEILGKISTKFNIRLAMIMKKNGLANDRIREGQVLKIPVRAEYTVKENDNLDALSKTFDVSKDAVLKASGLKSEKELKAGQHLYIPF